MAVTGTYRPVTFEPFAQNIVLNEFSYTTSSEIEEGHHSHISHNFWTTALVADGGLVLYKSRPELFRNLLVGDHWTFFGWWSIWHWRRNM